MITDLIDRLRWGRNTLHLVEFFVEEPAPETSVTEDTVEAAAA